MPFFVKMALFLPWRATDTALVRTLTIYSKGITITELVTKKYPVILFWPVISAIQVFCSFNFITKQTSCCLKNHYMTSVAVVRTFVLLCMFIALSALGTSPQGSADALFLVSRPRRGVSPVRLTYSIEHLKIVSIRLAFVLWFTISFKHPTIVGQRTAKIMLISFFNDSSYSSSLGRYSISPTNMAKAIEIIKTLTLAMSISRRGWKTTTCRSIRRSR